MRFVTLVLLVSQSDIAHPPATRSPQPQHLQVILVHVSMDTVVSLSDPEYFYGAS